MGYILIQVKPGSQGVAERVGQIPGVVKAERVHGAYDVIAEVRDARERTGSAHKIRELDGVLRAISLSTDGRAA